MFVSFLVLLHAIGFIRTYKEIYSIFQLKKMLLIIFFEVFLKYVIVLRISEIRMGMSGIGIINQIKN